MPWLIEVLATKSGRFFATLPRPAALSLTHIDYPALTLTLVGASHWHVGTFGFQIRVEGYEDGR